MSAQFQSKPSKWRYLLKSKIEDKEHALFVHRSCLVFVYSMAALQIIIGVLATFVIQDSASILGGGLVGAIFFAGIAFYTQKRKSIIGPILLVLMMAIDIGQALLANAGLIDFPKLKIGLLKVALMLAGICWVYALRKFKQFDS
ncbi:MAG: hypothetical protein IPP74_03825 [Alphaproteobacteria bacterium]|nr:hypothetical protein [Alphaproteobacteria bacterium]